MQRSTMRHAGAAVLTTATLASAGAASAADVTVTFTSAAPAAVPLSPEMMLVLGLAMAIGAVVVMRKRGMGNGLAYGMAAMIGLATLGTANNARAVESFTLTGPSPQVFTIVDNGGSTTLTNGTGGAVTITSISADSPYIAVGGNCYGDPLAPGDSCTVFLARPI
ncbi:midcut-by-XrtH protein [Brevundimonas staleyi]|uniref:Midcut-by-XrtH protein n=1 Tax=Brevundimonas staleyi TaxID=74326 RepID=A0ABW0FPE5_9CAUL